MRTRFVVLHRVVLLIVAASFAASVEAQVAIRFGGSGLSSISFDGSDFLSSGVLTANRITFEDGAGGTYDANLDGSVTVNAAAGEITNAYSWGTVAAVYRTGGNRLDVTLTVSNLGVDTIRGVFLEPLVLQLPEKPGEYDNVTPLMAFDPGEPGIIGLTCRTATLVLASGDPGKPILIGFPFANDRPTSTIFPLRINTDRESTYPTVYPTVNRPIAPGSSDQFHFSLRFGAGGAAVATLAADVYSDFAAVFPATLNWTDKRPIGQLVLATSAAGYPTNPRGWLLDPNLDTTTTAGIAAFKDRIFAWADQSIAILKQLNAQGMITWDIEGEQEYPACRLQLYRAIRRKAVPGSRRRWSLWQMPILPQVPAGRACKVGVCIRPQILTRDRRRRRRSTIKAT